MTEIWQGRFLVLCLSPVGFGFPGCPTLTMPLTPALNSDSGLFLDSLYYFCESVVLMFLPSWWSQGLDKAVTLSRAAILCTHHPHRFVRPDYLSVHLLCHHYLVTIPAGFHDKSSKTVLGFLTAFLGPTPSEILTKYLVYAKFYKVVIWCYKNKQNLN